ncbi:septum formation initiator family protein [Rhodocaloribacter litoris]|uniref:FtsB family cell division protein n=1 Tax=Rhodocaloribacter litoris TaxID=2558931 RepID=UPI001421DF4B|nr:septum formation initiator family protein [Rhodocaloribacter litoris]QXD15672.1 septum formation initiator family protein [Rhodocaloribacter litoris]GIV61606.1 MAG: hypothetical protein KatS3mg044_0472 [Rhodothermaceae bacterium]
MPARPSASPASPRARASGRLRRRIGLAALSILLAWLLFVDDYSLWKRLGWHREHAALRAENEALQARIDELHQKLEAGLSDEVVERIAREHYGMRRPGETVYRVEGKD